MYATVERDAFLDSLLARMTLTEKIGQLNYPSGSGIDTTGVAEAVDVPVMIRRGELCGISAGASVADRRELQRIAVQEGPNGIPLLFGKDCIQRYMTGGPIPLALSCSWDMDLIRRVNEMTAREARADGFSINWAPMLDICHDARWGRIAEGNGELPYLGARIAEVIVKAYQGCDLARPDRMMATLKHFLGYGLARAGRDYASVEASVATLARVMEPFRAGIEAGAGAVMVAFNTINDVPVTAHRILLQEVLRKRLGFKGLIVTDFTAIDPELMHHGVAENSREAAYLAFKSGVNIDLVSQAFLRHLAGLVADGMANPAAYNAAYGAYRWGPVTEAEVTERAREVLEAKWRLGLFRDPYLGMDEALHDAVTRTPQNVALVREAAAKSLVLLKNADNTLPLRREGGGLAVIGPMAHNRIDMQGTWAIDVDPLHSVTLLEGLRNAAGSHLTVRHAQGCTIVDDPSLAARLNIHNQTMPSVVLGPQSAKALLAEALTVAAEADAIVLCLGEAKEHTGESSTRLDIALPAAQRPLFDAIASLAKARGKPLVLVATAGRPLALEYEEARVDALIWTGHLGQEAGNGLADVLFGAANPSGRLSQALPRHVGQLPLRTEDLATGRPIWGSGVDVEGDTDSDAAGRRWFRKFTTDCILESPATPLYPAGYGLSYTQFDYGPLRASATELHNDAELSVAVDVTNAGAVQGAEVVQAWLRDLVGHTARPRRQLVRFERIELAPGETRTVVFRLTPADLCYPVGETLTSFTTDWEPGLFELTVGRHAGDGAVLRFYWGRD